MEPAPESLAYTVTEPNEYATTEVVEGKILICSYLVHVLFDTGATYSFISASMVKLLNLVPTPMGKNLYLSTPLGRREIPWEKCLDCFVTIEEHDMLVDLSVMEIKDFDVILGMDRLSKFYAHVDCYSKIVTFRPQG